MVTLSELDKNRVDFHLGIGSRAGVDAGDLAQIEEAVNNIPSDYQHQRIIDQLDICDTAWETARLVRTDNSRFTTKEQYAGDINRTVLRESARDIQVWQQNYLNETRELAQLLWVPNYREQGMDKYRYERSAGAFIQSIPGNADTSVASRLQQWWDFGGGWGIHKGYIRSNKENTAESEYILEYVNSAPLTNTLEGALFVDNNDKRPKFRKENSGDIVNITLDEGEIIDIANFFG